MKISVVVPIYNVQDCLERCVRSIMRQTYPNIEIILVDDGSPDSCGEMCDSFALEDARIKVIHKANGGLSDARNAGLELASGDYVLFVDSDDFIEADCCELFLDYMEMGPDILMGDCVTRNEGYAVKHYSNLNVNDCMTGMEYMVNALENRRFPVMVWLNLYKRKFLQDNQLQFLPGVYHEDIDFTPRVLLKAEKVVYTGIAFYHYMTNDASISARKDKRKNCSDIYRICCSLKDDVEVKKNKVLRKRLNNYLCECYMGMFRAGQLYRYGNEYVHKQYVISNSYLFRTKLKALLFCISPEVFCRIGKRNG